MLAADPEISRIVALRAIRNNLLRLEWHAAALRFELALRRHDRALKYGYHPDQPRVPAGVPEGGRWTSVYQGHLPPNNDKGPTSNRGKRVLLPTINVRVRLSAILPCS